MFLFDSDNSGLTNRNFNQAEPRVQKKQSLFAALTGEERPHVVGGLLFILVVLLHVWGALWLLKPPVDKPKASAMMVMEVSLVAPPQPPAPVVPPAPQPPAPPKPPEPPKKQPEKKVVKKKVPVVPKQVEVPKPQAVAEERPSLPSLPVVAPPAPPAPAASRPAPVSSEPKISTGVVPLERVPPKYPARAAERHIEGWVKVEFTIATDGTVKDATVVEAEPSDVFDEAALRAINQWIFREKIVDGVPVEQRAVQTLQFKLTR